MVILWSVRVICEPTIFYLWLYQQAYWFWVSAYLKRVAFSLALIGSGYPPWGAAWWWCHTEDLYTLLCLNYNKLLSRWYHYPVIVHSFAPLVLDTCWRCNSDTSTLLHIWWDCLFIKAFWDQVFAIYQKVSGTQLPNSSSFGITLLFLRPHT